MTTTIYRYATRLNSFRTGDDGKRTIPEMIAAVAAVPGVAAVELNYPQHITGPGDTAIIDLARSNRLDVTAINMRFDGDLFARGAFTSPNPAARERAIALCKEALDVAAQTGIDHLIVWPGPDGFDYPLQADYVQLWDWEVAALREIANYRPAIRVSFEYKPSDPRRSSLIRGMGEALLAVQEAGAPNLGVTFDLCHGLMTGETPGNAVAMALRAGKLFGVHLNDGLGAADDGLMVATIHLSQMLEVLWYLKRYGFSGTFYFDTFPERVDPAAECARNIATMERLGRLLGRIDEQALIAAQHAQDAVAAQGIWLDAVLGHD